MPKGILTEQTKALGILIKIFFSDPHSSTKVNYANNKEGFLF